MTRRRVTWSSLFPRSDANYADTLCFGNHQIEKIKIMLRVAVQRHGEALHTRGQLPRINRIFYHPVDSMKIKRAGRAQTPGFGVGHHRLAVVAGLLV